MTTLGPPLLAHTRGCVSFVWGVHKRNLGKLALIKRLIDRLTM